VEGGKADSDAVDGSSTGTRVRLMWVLLGHPMIRRSQGMHTTTTVGLDISKSVFQVHGIGTDGNVVVRRQLKRRYVLTKRPSIPLAELAVRVRSVGSPALE
jgi:hypothetical protein